MKTHDTMQIETFHGQWDTTAWRVKAQYFLYPLCQLHLSFSTTRWSVSRSSLTPLTSPIHSLQFRCFPQRSKRFKAQDSRCTVKVGSMQLNFCAGWVGSSYTPCILQNPDSKALKWIYTVVLGLSRHGWVKKIKKASMWNLINLLGSAFWGRRSRRGGEFPRAGSKV